MDLYVDLPLPRELDVNILGKLRVGQVKKNNKIQKMTLRTSNMTPGIAQLILTCIDINNRSSSDVQIITKTIDLKYIAEVMDRECTVGCLHLYKNNN